MVTAEQRVTRFNGVEVYPPFCWSCGTDRHSEWKDLPSLEKLHAPGHCFDFIRGYCSYCEKIIDSNHEEAFKAREPERLEARLAELRAAASPSSRQGPNDGGSQ